MKKGRKYKNIKKKKNRKKKIDKEKYTSLLVGPQNCIQCLHKDNRQV